MKTQPKIEDFVNLVRTMKRYISLMQKGMEALNKNEIDLFLKTANRQNECFENLQKRTNRLLTFQTSGILETFLAQNSEAKKLWEEKNGYRTSIQQLFLQQKQLVQQKTSQIATALQSRGESRTKIAGYKSYQPKTSSFIDQSS